VTSNYNQIEPATVQTISWTWNFSSSYQKTKRVYYKSYN